MYEISPKADISPKAIVGENCKIYPFVYIEDDVVIGDNCTIYPFVSILNGTRMGSNNQVFQNSVLGALPQDFNFRGEDSQLIVGNNNVIRENVVINRATHSGGKTVIGNDNMLMEGAHISHDTKVGNGCIFGYSTKIAGDCLIEDHVVFSSGVIEHAGSRVGTAAMIQAGAAFSKDVPPYVVITPDGEYGGINVTLCRHLGIGEKAIKHISNAYRLVFHGQTSLFDAVLQVKEQVPDGEEVQRIVRFLETVEKGLIDKI